MIDREKMQWLEIKLWFAENELYLDGSNAHKWLPELKKQISRIFEIDKIEPEKEAKKHD